MATIKSFTSLEQSKKLAEILPFESADMYYLSGHEYDICSGSGIYEEIADWLSDGTSRPADIPCWSLAALLDVLPFPVLYMEMLGGAILWCCERHFMETEEVVKIEHYDNPVDACYEMIIKLNELKML